MVKWRAYLPVQDTYENNLLDVYVRDGYNRFARKADIKVSDPNGGKRATYTRGTPVQLEVDDGSGYELRWAGFVVDPQTSNNSITVELYGHDLWLRKRNVLTDYDEKSIREILKDLITRLTPLKWNPDLVEVSDNQTISINYKGQQLDEVINELASFSAGEYFGATNQREFFFRPTAVSESPRDFRRGSYTEADFNEDGTREVNQVTLYYNDGNDAITVDNRDAQNDLQDSLDEDENVVLDVTRSFPEVEQRSIARKKANAILEGRLAVRTGTLTTWEGFDIEPGQETYVVVPEQDVDREMRIAQVEYWWMDDETKVKVAAGGSDDIIDTLVDLSDTVERIEQQGANADADLTRFISQEIPFELDFELTAKKRTIPDDQFLLGERKGNLGDTAVGGGYLGDQASDWTNVPVRLGELRNPVTYTAPVASSATSINTKSIVNTWDGERSGTHAADYLAGSGKLQLYPVMSPDTNWSMWHLNGGDYSDIGDLDIDMTTVDGSVTEVADGIFSAPAIKSDGTGYLRSTSGTNRLTTDLVMWVWFRADSHPDNDTYLIQTTDGSERAGIEYSSDGSLRAYAHGDTNGSIASASTTAPLGQYNMVLGEWDGSSGSFELYLNGSSAGSLNWSDFDVSVYQEWLLGANPYANGSVFQGEIAAAGMTYGNIPFIDIGRLSGDEPGYYSDTLTFDNAVSPDVTLGIDSLPSGYVNVRVVADSETFTHQFTGTETWSPGWTTTHTDFTVEVEPVTNDVTESPIINKVTLLP